MASHNAIRDQVEQSGKSCQIAIIGFPGSGTEASLAWQALVDKLIQEHTIVLFDTSPNSSSLTSRINNMISRLSKDGLDGPFVLVAHSYGGYFAKQFLYMYREQVAGVVLVETGKGGERTKEEDTMLRRSWMGSKPLSVIRGNSLLGQWQSLNDQIANVEQDDIDARRKWLQTCDEEDERLEKEQLRLSQNHHYVHLPQCGHNVIRDACDVVVAELQWVIKNRSDEASSTSIRDWLYRLFKIKE